MAQDREGCEFDVPTTAHERLVSIPGHGVVTLDLLEFAADLDRRGCSWEFSDDGKLLIRPNALLSDADRTSLRAHGQAFIALVRQWEAIQ